MMWSANLLFLRSTAAVAAGDVTARVVAFGVAHRVVRMAV